MVRACRRENRRRHSDFVAVMTLLRRKKTALVPHPRHTRRDGSDEPMSDIFNFRNINVLQLQNVVPSGTFPLVTSRISRECWVVTTYQVLWVWTTKFDTASWPFFKFDMRHGALVTQQEGENL